MSSEGYSTPSVLRTADHTEDSRKDSRRHPRSCTPALGKNSPRKPSESVQPLVKASKHLKLERERREHKSEREKNRGNKGASKAHAGNSKTDSRSERLGKRKGDDAKNLAETRSSKGSKTRSTEVCKSESRHAPDKKGSGKEKKSDPVSERNIWEEGMKVKPQKRISINISLDGRKKEEQNGQTQMIALESSTGKPEEDVQKSDNGGEEKVNETESSGELGGEAKEEMYPEEREHSQIWKEELSDHQDQVAEDREKKAGWHCIFRHEEEEEESKGLQEEHEGMKASTSKEVTIGEGRSGGQERREFMTGGSASTGTELQLEVESRMETKEDQTRSMSERAETEESSRSEPLPDFFMCTSVNTASSFVVVYDRHGSHGSGLEEHTQDRASEGEGTIKQVGLQKCLRSRCRLCLCLMFSLPCSLGRWSHIGEGRICEKRAERRVPC